jgi:hypothetical protein
MKTHRYGPQGHFKNDVGLAVRFFRMRGKRQMSQRTFSGRLSAKNVTLDQSAIARVECQQRYVLDYELVAMAAALGVSVGHLLKKNKSLRGQ